MMSQNRNLGPYLRGLRSSDAESIYEIEKQVYSEPWSLSLLRDSLKAPMTYGLGLFQNGEILGYGIYQVILSEGHLLNLAIHPHFQNKGMGSYLLDQIIADVSERGAQSFYLEVRVSNQYARHLYEKKGFKALMLREKYYADGEAALIMILNRLQKRGEP